MLEALNSRWIHLLAVLAIGIGIGLWIAPTPDPLTRDTSVRETDDHSESHSRETHEKTVVSILPNIFQPTYQPAVTHNVRGTPRADSMLCPVFDASGSIVLPDSGGVLFFALDSIDATSQTIGRVTLTSWFKPRISLDTNHTHELVEKNKDSTTDSKRKDSTSVVTNTPDSPLLTSGFVVRASLLARSSFGLAAIRPGLFSDLHIGKPNDGIRPLSLGLSSGIDPQFFSFARPLDAVWIDVNARVTLYWR